MPAAAKLALKHAAAVLLQQLLACAATSACEARSADLAAPLPEAAAGCRFTGRLPADSVAFLQHEIVVVESSATPIDADGTEASAARRKRVPKKRASLFEFTMAHLISEVSEERVAAFNFFTLLLVVLIFLVGCLLGGILVVRSGAFDSTQKEPAGEPMQNDHLVRAQEPPQRRRSPASSRAGGASTVTSKDCCIGFMQGPTAQSKRGPGSSPRPESPGDKSMRSVATVTTQNPVTSSSVPKGVRFSGHPEVLHYASDGRRP